MPDHSSANHQGDRSRREPSQGPSPRRQSGPFNPSVLGRAAHEVIATLAADGLRVPDYERITAAVQAHPATKQSPVRRQAARLWLASTASLYFRLFALPPVWVLVGSEVGDSSCRFDLVWRNVSDGTVLADELKTGKAGDLVGGRALDDQLDRERRAGVASYGSLFVGVRLLVLAAPRRSFLVAADASRIGLYPGSPA